MGDVACSPPPPHHSSLTFRSSATLHGSSPGEKVEEDQEDIALTNALQEWHNKTPCFDTHPTHTQINDFELLETLGKLISHTLLHIKQKSTWQKVDCGIW